MMKASSGESRVPVINARAATTAPANRATTGPGRKRPTASLRTGKATDFWNRYAEDFERARSIGLKAFRLSVEWARVQPSAATGKGAPPPFDLAALDHYAAIIASCRAHGLEPVVTLHHFTHPDWLGIDAWLDDDAPTLFAKFVETAATHINRRLIETHAQLPIHWFVTLNEPNMLVLNTYLNRHFPGGGSAGFKVGITAYNRLLAAHVLAYNAIHDVYEAAAWAKPMVTMNTFAPMPTGRRKCSSTCSFCANARSIRKISRATSARAPKTSTSP